MGTVQDIDIVEIDRRLDVVKDPCSLAAGTPLGLAEMGLVRGRDYDRTTGTLTVRLCVTSPACFLSGQMVDGIRGQLADIPGVRTVEVEIDSSHRWSHDDATPAARDRLTHNRAVIVELHGLRPQMWRDAVPDGDGREGRESKGSARAVNAE